MLEIKHINITLRRPLNDADPGECARGCYIVADGVVYLTDSDGVKLKRGADQKLTTRTKAAKDQPLWSSPLPEGRSERAVAARLLQSKVSSERRGTDFHRPLQYPRNGFV
jgi:hypothetical protein